MGNLVFQATLGGQVNLVGPNTASTYNLNVPAVSSTIATTSGTETLTNKTLTTPVINGFTGDTSVVNIGSGQFYKDTSGNLGLGTSSPTRILTIEKSGTTFPSASNPSIRLNETSSGRFAIMELDSSANLNIWNGDTGAGSIKFYRGGGSGTLSMTLDGSGNLGLGVTPSAWSGVGATLQVGVSAAIIGNSVSSSSFLSNAYYDGSNYKYIGTGYAARLALTSGAYAFQTAGSGTAGAAITFTQAMTLDASGNLGIGTTSPGYKLAVAGTAGSAVLNLIETGVRSWGIRAGGAATNTFDIADFTAGATRLTIDSSGNLLVGTTDAGTTTGVGVKTLYSATQPTVVTVGSGSTSAGNSAYVLYSTGAAALRFYVGYDGVIHATSTSISAISDASLKTNVKDLETGLSEVLALKPRRFDWINGDATNVAGFIAQEVEEVLPELVSDAKYSYDENGDEITKKNLKMGDILPTLVKAIQEQQAIITQLQADVAALKGQA